MAKKRNFCVTQPPVILWLSGIIIAFFLVLTVIEILTKPAPHTAILVLVTLFVFIPCGFIILWAAMFRIHVEGTTVTVRRCCGIINQRFDISEVTAVDCILAETNMGIHKKITLRTTDGKKVPIESLMINSGKMIQFIEEYVDPSKFRTVTKSFRRRK